VTCRLGSSAKLVVMKVFDVEALADSLLCHCPKEQPPWDIFREIAERQAWVMGATGIISI
jgi:hypothetical protein